MLINQKNYDIEILKLSDPKFGIFGKVLNIDTDEIINSLEKTKMPQEGNLYTPSCDELEYCLSFSKELQQVYGSMPFQVGFCNGFNSSINGLEYHKGSEIITPNRDVILFLGHTNDLVDNKFNVTDGNFFYIPAKTVLEIYQTTLHLSPIKTTLEGFKCVIALPADTNTDFEKGFKPEGILFKKNKWMISHPDNTKLTNQGVYAGLNGENIKILI